MTPEERAVIEAARAYVAAWADSARHYHGPEAERLNAAVRALPRPLAERLAELRPGAVVETLSGNRATFAFKSPKSGKLFLHEPDRDVMTGVYPDLIARIISNPEPGRE